MNRPTDGCQERLPNRQEQGRKQQQRVGGVDGTFGEDGQTRVADLGTSRTAGRGGPSS